MKKRALSFFLAVLFLLGVCPAVLADGEEPVFRLTHVTETTEDGVNEYAFTYEGDGMFPTQVVCSGVDGDGTITAQYDPDGRITSLTSTGVYSYFGTTTASFNDRGDPVYIRYAREETYGDSQTQAYTYDDEGRLTSVGVAYTEYGAPVAPTGPAGPWGPVAPVAPWGITKLSTAAEAVPVLVTAAAEPGAPVVTVPTVTVAGVPAGPAGPVAPWGPGMPWGPLGPGQGVEAPPQFMMFPVQPQGVSG